MVRKNLEELIAARRKALKEKSIRQSLPVPMSLQAYNFKSTPAQPFYSSNRDGELFSRLTTLHDFKQPYEGEPKGDLFIHWFYRERKEDHLSRCEIFHFNMLQYFNVMARVEVIHVRCATKDSRVTNTMQHVISILSSGKARVDFKCVPQESSWEHNTIMEATEYAVETGRFVYYTHFKGVSRVSDPSLGMPVIRHKYGELDVLYWTYILYDSLFDKCCFKNFRGPILRNSVNASYIKHDYDCTWTVHKARPNYHYAGSFQAFDGATLKDMFTTLGMLKEDRQKKLWVNDPYTVEMLLSLCSSPSEVAFAHLGIGIGIASYNMYQMHKYRASLHTFKNLYVRNPPARIKAKYVVLTYLYGKHTLLREPLYIDNDVEYICVSDRSDVQSKTWKVVTAPMEYLEDDRLRTAYVKFHPFEFVDACKVLVLDASYQITDSLLPLFEHACKPIMLLPHLYRSNIREELSEWVRIRRMSKEQAKWFTYIAPYLGGTLDEPLFELSASVWSDTPEARLLGVETYSILEYNGFPSNQMPCSLLAERHFKGSVAPIAPEDMVGLIKYKHNKWEPCIKQSGKVVVDLERFSPKAPLRVDSPRVLSTCQGDDELLRRACFILKWPLAKVSNDLPTPMEEIMNRADIVVGTGRLLYEAMACGRVCISYDSLNSLGCGYVTKDNWQGFADTNFTGRGFPWIESVRQLLGELRKYNPKDGADMREMVEKELDTRKTIVKYSELAGISK